MPEGRQQLAMDINDHAGGVSEKVPKTGFVMGNKNEVNIRA